MATIQKRSSTWRAGVALLVLFVMSGVCLLDAQLLRPKDPMPSFEVATIKPWSPVPVVVAAGSATPPKVKIAPGEPAPSGDRVHFIGQIELLIETAYGLPFSSGRRIVGGPDWMWSESDRYEVTAKVSEADYAAIQKMSPSEQKEQIALREQALLADRFKLRAHIETKEMPRYALVVAKGGSKLKRAANDAKSQMSLMQGAENELRATAVTAEQLAESPFLRFDKREVVDRTGLQGTFTFTLKFRANGIANVGGVGEIRNVPELPTALEEQLGLRLVPENGLVEVLVIDHIERPSEN